MNCESQTKTELLESLVDIRDVRIDRSLPVEERVRSYVVQCCSIKMRLVREKVDWCSSDWKKRLHLEEAISS